MDTGEKGEGAADAAPSGSGILTSIVRLGGAISTALILAMLGITVYAVLLRYLFSAPPIWADQLSGFALVAMVMLGTAEAYRRGNHIAIDVLTEGPLRRARRSLMMLGDLCVLGFAVVLGISAWESITFNRAFGAYTSGSIEIEAWIPQLPLLFGAVLLGTLAIVRLVRAAQGVTHR